MNRDNLLKIIEDGKADIDKYKNMQSNQGIVIPREDGYGDICIGYHSSSTDFSRVAIVAISPRVDGNMDWIVGLETLQDNGKYQRRDVHISSEMLFLLLNSVVQAFEHIGKIDNKEV